MRDMLKPMRLPAFLTEIILHGEPEAGDETVAGVASMVRPLWFKGNKKTISYKHILCRAPAVSCLGDLELFV